MSIAALLAALGPLIAALAPVLAQWTLRRWAAAQDPKTILQKERDENAQVVAGNNVDDLNRVLDERINGLRK